MVTNPSKLAILLCLAIPWHVHAKETDQFTFRRAQQSGLPGRESTQQANAKMNRYLRRLERQLNASRAKTRDERYAQVAEIFQNRFQPAIISPIETWIASKASPIRIFRLRGDRGIYAKAGFDDMSMGWYGELAPTLKLGDVVQGVDKIGHFTGQGWQYLKYYWQLERGKPITAAHAKPCMARHGIKRGADFKLTDAQMMECVLMYGDTLERRELGLASIGVYSYADLAANIQGFHFYRELFSGHAPYFRFDSPTQKYVQIRSFDWRDYVTDDWDEVINPSRLRSEQFFNKVSATIRKRICPEYKKDPAGFMGRTGNAQQWSAYVSPDIDHKALGHRLDLERLCTVGGGE